MDHRVARILAETDEETRFRLIGDLILGEPDSGVAVGQDLLSSTDPASRALGADVLGQAATVATKVPRGVSNLLRARLSVEDDPTALAAAVVALGHLRDSDAGAYLARLAEHAAQEVRHAVAVAYPAVGLDDRAIEVLEALSRDVDIEVRDWATFALAECDRDDEGIRDALRERAEDPDVDTRAEGIYGLARRHDSRAPDLVEREFARGSPGTLIIRAREELIG